ncbi:MAG TPA: cell division protein ZapE [Gammaproteobacteria bacterium]|nr:cell division protein ZapE [Gammaproteobacteria bacterium]
MLTPYERYQHALATGEYLPDENQANIIDYFQKLYLYIEDNTWFKKKPSDLKLGLYIWGSVGVGKTWLMDLFFQSLTSKLKTRMHFHDFMREMHDQLQRLQGNADPLKKIAKQFARNTKVLCFDEFYVSDIGDAMILANLFEAFFKERIIIIATSNVIPDNLYKDGLQRARFLPAISLIKKNMSVLHLPTIRDYRLRELEEAGIFFSPLSPETHHKVEKLFTQLAHGEIKVEKDIYLHDRTINTIKFADNIIWLDFKKLCSIPRSQMDYLSIVKRWSTVIIDNVKAISEKDINTAKYFINLIDILYDSRITLILRSECPIDDIYKSGELSFEFKRTKSRLTEMQSTYYLQEAEEKLCLK